MVSKSYILDIEEPIQAAEAYEVYLKSGYFQLATTDDLSPGDRVRIRINLPEGHGVALSVKVVEARGPGLFAVKLPANDDGRWLVGRTKEHHERLDRTRGRHGVRQAAETTAEREEKEKQKPKIRKNEPTPRPSKKEQQKPAQETKPATRTTAPEKISVARPAPPKPHASQPHHDHAPDRPQVPQVHDDLGTQTRPLYVGPKDQRPAPLELAPSAKLADLFSALDEEVLEKADRLAPGPGELLSNLSRLEELAQAHERAGRADNVTVEFPQGEVTADDVGPKLGGAKAQPARTAAPPAATPTAPPHIAAAAAPQKYAAGKPAPQPLPPRGAPAPPAAPATAGAPAVPAAQQKGAAAKPAPPVPRRSATDAPAVPPSKDAPVQAGGVKPTGQRTTSPGMKTVSSGRAIPAPAEPAHPTPAAPAAPPAAGPSASSAAGPETLPGVGSPTLPVSVAGAGQAGPAPIPAAPRPLAPEELWRLPDNKKKKLAISGELEQRRILARDPDKAIHLWVLKNPALTEDEAAELAMLESLSPEALTFLLQNRRWATSQRVAFNLARNPNVPSQSLPNVLAVMSKDVLKKFLETPGLPPLVEHLARKVWMDRLGK